MIWTGWMAINAVTGYLTIRQNADGSHILSPTFEGIVSSVKITTSSNSTAQSRTLIIMDATNEVAEPTTSTEGVLGYKTISNAGSESFTIDNLNHYGKTNFKIYSRSNTAYISDIEVTYIENNYDSTLPACPVISIVDEGSSSLDFGTITIPNTSSEQTVKISGKNLTGALNLDIINSSPAGGAFATDWVSAPLPAPALRASLADEEKTLWVTFTPQVAGASHTATLRVSSAGAIPVDIALSGVEGITTSLDMISSNGVTAYSLANNIYLSNLPEPATIYVYNVAGQLVAVQNASASNATLPMAQKGIYLIKIVSANGAQTLKTLN